MRTIALVAVLVAAVLADDVITKGSVNIDNRQDSRQPESKGSVRKGEINANYGGSVLTPKGKGKARSATSADLTAGNGNADFETQNNREGNVVAAKGSNKAQANFKGTKGTRKYDGERQVSSKGTAKGQIKPSNGKGEQKADWKGVSKGSASTYNVANTRKSGAGGWTPDRGADEGKGTFKGKGGLAADIAVGNSAESNELTLKGAKKNNGEYVNTLTTDERRDETVVTLKDSAKGLGRGGLDAECTGTDNGITRCRNGRKQSPGVRQSDRNNEAAVLTANNRELANVNVATTGNRRSGPVHNAYINPANPRGRGRNTAKLYLGNASNFKQRDCYGDIIKGKRDPNPNDLKVVNETMKIVYNFEEEGGKSVYTFPDCFKVSVDVVLGRDVRVQDLAYEVQARISPVGDLLCADPGVCGKGACYYCDLCDRDKERLALTSNVDRSEACDKAGPQRVTLSTTVCPPPEDYDYEECAAISNPYASDFWRKTKDPAIIVRFLVWTRPKEVDSMRDSFYHNKKNTPGFLDNLKKAYIANLVKEGKLERVNIGGFTSGNVQINVSEYELLHFYLTDGVLLRPAQYKEQLLMCEAGEADYDVGGSKAGANVLVEAASKIKSGGKVEDNAFQATCPAVEAIHAKQVEEMESDWEASGMPQGTNPDPLSLVSSLLGGGGRNRGGGFSSLFGGRRRR